MSGKLIGGVILIVLGIDMIFKINLFSILIPMGIIALEINMIIKSRSK